MSKSEEIPAAVARYGGIIFRERPVHDGDLFSRRHPRMTRLNRAKIFAPFAALAGFDERVSRKEITYVPRREPDADEEWAVNRRLFELHGLTANSRQVRAGPVRVCVEYFVPCDDMENAAYGVGGRYETLTGVVLKVEPREQRLLLRGESGDRAIPFSDIYRISAPSG